VTTTRTLQNDEIRTTKLEGMTNGQIPNDYDVTASSPFACHAVAGRRRGLRHSFVIGCSVILMIVVEMRCIALAQAQSPNMIGRWNVEINFADGNKRSLRFDAQDSGKGTLLVLDPRLKVWGPGKPSEAKWAREDQNSVTFSGPVEFMLGNVGRDAGTLMFKGKFETPDVITGQVEFAPLVGQRPSKRGTFKATRDNSAH
jgi:hypothetical protein